MKPILITFVSVFDLNLLYVYEFWLKRKEPYFIQTVLLQMMMEKMIFFMHMDLILRNLI